MDHYKITTDKELLELAHSLGDPISSRKGGPLIDDLIPLTAENAHPQSLSANFGTNNFPFHTDGAYFQTPPRYIVLRYVKGIENPTPTIICNLNSVAESDRKVLQFSIWKIRSVKPFYSSILSPDGEYFRYDPCIMSPINEKNNNSGYFENVIENSVSEIIDWVQNKTVVIDNWHYLHKRPVVKKEEINFRTIQRIMIL